MQIVNKINHVEMATKALFLVTKCCQHYAKYKRPIDTIFLEPSVWDYWRLGMIAMQPELEAELVDEMHFKNCKVKKGSRFQVEPLKVELKKRVLA